MKKKLTIVFAALMVLAMALAVVGCGSKPTLDEWYNDNKSEFDEMLDAANATASTTGVTMNITVENSNVLVYEYTLLDEFPTDADTLSQLAALYDSQFTSLEPTFTELLNQMESETSTTGISIRLAVYNPDGTELYARDFTK